MSTAICTFASSQAARPAESAAHHIVPHGAKEVAAARAVLARFGIRIDEAVNKLLTAAKTREEVLEALQYIRDALLTGKFP